MFYITYKLLLCCDYIEISSFFGNMSNVAYILNVRLIICECYIYVTYMLHYYLSNSYENDLGFFNLFFY